MLTPTDVHFLIGLLTLVSRPDGIELELGSMVFDAAAEEERDVDITVRAQKEDGTILAFEGIEVKHHTRPLDVTHIEQLCAKFRDMPGITAPSIVSGSGYYDPAVKKAKRSGVTLYTLRDWIAPMEFAGVKITDEFKFHEQTYQWVGQPHVTLNPNLHLPNDISDQISLDTPVFDKNGASLSTNFNLQTLVNNLTSQTTALAEQQGQPLQMSIGETRNVTFNITLEDEPFVVIGGTKISLMQAQVTGEITYIEKIISPAFKVLVRHEDQQPFVGCAVFQMSQGNLAGISINAKRRISFINIPIADRLLKKIYRRKIGRGNIT